MISVGELKILENTCWLVENIWRGEESCCLIADNF